MGILPLLPGRRAGTLPHVFMNNPGQSGTIRAGAAGLAFWDVYDARATARFVPLMMDSNARPARPVCSDEA